MPLHAMRPFLPMEEVSVRVSQVIRGPQKDKELLPVGMATVRNVPIPPRREEYFTYDYPKKNVL